MVLAAGRKKVRCKTREAHGFTVLPRKIVEFVSNVSMRLRSGQMGEALLCWRNSSFGVFKTTRKMWLICYDLFMAFGWKRSTSKAEVPAPPVTQGTPKVVPPASSSVMRLCQCTVTPEGLYTTAQFSSFARTAKPSCHRALAHSLSEGFSIVQGLANTSTQ